MLLPYSPLNLPKHLKYCIFLRLKCLFLLLKSKRAKNRLVTILMNDFYDVYPKEKILADREATLRAQEKMNQWSPLDYAHRVELLFLDGILHDNWLGRGVIVSEAALYDDFKHRVDIIVTIEDTVIALDITTARTPEAIRRKLPNVETALGHTHVTYYNDGEHHAGKKTVPYFIVGVSGYLIREARKQLNATDKDVHISDFSKLKTATRNKILYQIWAEMILEAKYYQREVKNDLLKERFKKLEEYLWPRFLRLALKNKNFNCNLPQEPDISDTFQATSRVFL